jgi:putative hydrolase of the HAD superfamily
MAPARPSLLLFDLGGVLVDYTGQVAIQAILSEPFTRELLHEKWAATEVALQFELGLVEPEVFAEAFAAQWPLTCSASEFLAHFESWTAGLMPGASELLDQLRPRYRLAALSNSNATHWRRNNEILGVSGLFERAFSSHELGMRKPNPAIYEHTLRELAVQPHETVFFDDLAENVEAARGVGMAAHQVRGVEELRACLSGLGLLRI